MADETKPEPAKSTEPTAKKSKKKAASKSGQTRRAKKKPSPAAKVKKSSAARAKTTSKPRPRRKQSTTSERAKILAAADREGLTALQVQKRFGVKPVTYYSWRKASKKSGSPIASPVGASLAGADIAGQVRLAIRAQVTQLLPLLLQEELDAALGGLVPGRRGRPRRAR